MFDSNSNGNNPWDNQDQSKSTSTIDSNSNNIYSNSFYGSQSDIAQTSLNTHDPWQAVHSDQLPLDNTKQDQLFFDTPPLITSIQHVFDMPPAINSFEELPDNTPKINSILTHKELTIVKVKLEPIPSRVLDKITVQLASQHKSLFGHLDYKITSSKHSSSVTRRYSDFLWLQDVLLKRYPFRNSISFLNSRFIATQEGRRGLKIH